MSGSTFNTSDYYKGLKGILANATATEAEKAKAQAELDRIDKEQFEATYGPKSFDIGEFESLLGRLEGSKMRQQRQKSVEGRRDIMSQGLASMMSNF